MVQVAHAVHVPNLTTAVAIIHIKKQHNEVPTVPRMIHYVQKLMPTVFYTQIQYKLRPLCQCNSQEEWRNVTYKQPQHLWAMMATDLFKLNLWIEWHITCVTEVLVGLHPSCIGQLLHTWGNLSWSYRSRGHLHCWSPSIRTYQHHWSSILSIYHISHLPRVASLMR